MKKGTSIALAVALSIVAGLAGLVGAAWTPDRSVESLQERWARPPSKFVTIDGLSIHLRDEGPGNDPRPVVSSMELHPAFIPGRDGLPL